MGKKGGENGVEEGKFSLYKTQLVARSFEAEVKEMSRLKLRLM